MFWKHLLCIMPVSFCPPYLAQLQKVPLCWGISGYNNWGWFFFEERGHLFPSVRRQRCASGTRRPAVWLPWTFLTTVWAHGQGWGAGYLCIFHPRSLRFSWSAILGKDCPLPCACSNAKWKYSSSQSFISDGHWVDGGKVLNEEERCFLAFTQRWLHSRTNKAECSCLKVGRGERGGRGTVLGEERAWCFCSSSSTNDGFRCPGLFLTGATEVWSLVSCTEV